MDSAPLEEIVARQHWAEGQAPPQKAELQRLVTTLLTNPHETPEELKDLEGIHNSIRLDDILPYAPFRALYTKWILPKDRLVKQDEILLRVHYALTVVPNRDKIKAELSESILASPPSYESFCTAGGMQGLTYAMMKA